VTELPTKCLNSLMEAIGHIISHIGSLEPDAIFDNHKLFWTLEGLLSIDTDKSGYYFHYDGTTFRFHPNPFSGIMEYSRIGPNKSKTKDNDCLALYEGMGAIILRAATSKKEVPRVSRLAEIAKARIAEAEAYQKEGAITWLTSSKDGE